eukprot:2023719-Amphidinium_carterae.1
MDTQPILMGVNTQHRHKALAHQPTIFLTHFPTARMGCTWWLASGAFHLGMGLVQLRPAGRRDASSARASKFY